jgi:preprotein translocase subunit SecE
MMDIKGIYQKVRQFLREVRAELKRVTWPSRKETMGSTAIVVVLVLIVALFLAVVDLGLHTMIRQVIS